MLQLDNVLYVLAATIRLISVSSLCDGPLALKVTFSNSSITLTKGDGSTIFQGGQTAKSLYTMDSVLPSSALATTHPPKLETIDHRYGHPNYAVVWDIARRLRASGMPLDLSEPPFKCEPCILGKETQMSVPKTQEGERSKVVGELIFIDAAGLQATESATGNLYTLDLLDEFSSTAWAFPVPTKSEMAAVFKCLILAFHAFGHNIKSVQIDNGKLVTNGVTALCTDLGIRIRRTAPYISAHNRQVERLHRSLMAHLQTMRVGAGIPENRWDELYSTACYLYNRTPSFSLPPGKTPYELFYGLLPKVDHLHEIGCHAFILIPTHNAQIRARSFVCILIGYGSDSKTYHCYHCATHRVITSFHVVFIKSHGDPSYVVSQPSPAISPPPSVPADDFHPAPTMSTPTRPPLTCPPAAPHPAAPSTPQLSIPSTSPRPATPAIPIPSTSPGTATPAMLLHMYAFHVSAPCCAFPCPPCNTISYSGLPS